MRYEVIVIGNTPAGRAGALAAAKARKSVALLERPPSLASGLLPEGEPLEVNLLRQVLVDLSTYRYRLIWNNSSEADRSTLMQHLRQTLAEAVSHESEMTRDLLARNGVTIYRGDVRFSGPHEIEVDDLLEVARLEGESVLIACGTKPARAPGVPFDGRTVIAADELPNLRQTPRSLVLAGADTAGVQYGVMLAMLGVHVTVVESPSETWTYRDDGLAGLVLSMASSPQFTLTSEVEIARIDRLEDGNVSVRLEGGDRIIAEVAAFNRGRRGSIETLNLPAAGLVPDDLGRLWCNDNLQTWQPHIFGCGEIVGFPETGETPQQQSERAVLHALARQAPQGLRIDGGTAPSPKPAGSRAAKPAGSFIRG